MTSQKVYPGHLVLSLHLTLSHVVGQASDWTVLWFSYKWWWRGSGVGEGLPWGLVSFWPVSAVLPSTSSPEGTHPGKDQHRNSSWITPFLTLISMAKMVSRFCRTEQTQRRQSLTWPFWLTCSSKAAMCSTWESFIPTATMMNSRGGPGLDPNRAAWPWDKLPKC